MYDSIFSSVLETLQEHTSLTQNHTVVHRPRKPLFDSRSPYYSISANLPDVTSRFSSLGLPAALSHELNTLLINDLNEDKVVVDTARQRLLEQLSIASSSPDPSAIPPLVQAAFDAFYNRSVHSRLDTLQQEISQLSLQEGSEAESVDSTDSEQESVSGDDDAADEVGEIADEDDNAPARPGEDVPPLDTKYLPIFEALHERGKVLTKPEKAYLVDMTGMTFRQITIWFQNRRRGELKEDMNVHASSSHAASVHSDQTSDASDEEIDLEQQVLANQSDNTFNIRSWCLASAVATKGDAHTPLSPNKPAFGYMDTIPSFASDDDTDLSDSDDEVDVPPGLGAPSLTMSATTFDSDSNHGPATATCGSSPRAPPGSFLESVVSNGTTGGVTSFAPRPVKSLPASRRGSPPTSVQPTPPQQTPSFGFNFTDTTPASTQQQFRVPESNQPSQFVTSNESGLTLQLDTALPTTVTTLQSPATSSISTTFAASTIPATTGSPLSPVLSNGSRNNTPSPSSSGPHATSPRPATRPLPRRTGCAPRPRPPPRAASVSTAAGTSSAMLGSARPSIVLPPTSNPSLSNTTLGALLRPNPIPPKIPVEMEERLAAMAGRMGVNSGSSPVRRSISTDASRAARGGVSPGVSTLPPRGSSFSFGAVALPGVRTLPSPMLTSIPEQPRDSASGSPSS